MLDEEFGGPALDAGAVPSSVGLIMPLEAQGYETIGDGRTTTLLDDFSPADALRRGADACKILLPYRADHEPSATAQDALVARPSPPATRSACRWSSNRSPIAGRARPRRRSRTPIARLVLDAVRAAGAARRGPAQAALPGVRPGRRTARAAAADACRELAVACGDTPWVLLGAGADGETFIEQIRIAGRSRRIGLPRRPRDLGRGPRSGSRSGRAARGDDRPSAVRAMPGDRRADRAAPRRGRGRLTAATDRPACRPSSPGS